MRVQKESKGDLGSSSHGRLGNACVFFLVFCGLVLPICRRRCVSFPWIESESITSGNMISMFLRGLKQMKGVSVVLMIFQISDELTRLLFVMFKGVKTRPRMSGVACVAVMKMSLFLPGPGRYQNLPSHFWVAVAAHIRRHPKTGRLGSQRKCNQPLSQKSWQSW